MEPIVRIQPGAEVAVCIALVATGLLFLTPMVPAVSRWIYTSRKASAKRSGVPCEAPDPGTPLGYWNATRHWFRLSSLLVAAGIAALFHDGRVQWGLIIFATTVVWILNMILLSRLSEETGTRSEPEETGCRT